jgi:hypothetical protein
VHPIRLHGSEHDKAQENTIFPDMIKRYIVLTLVTIIPLISKSQSYCNLIERIQDYQDSVKLKHLSDFDILDSTTFNIHQYLSFFDEIEIEEGIKFDVYYLDNFMDGNPYLYALKEGQNPVIKNKKSTYIFLNRNEIRAKNHIKPKDTNNGFLQYLFFSEFGEQFALKWHANYDNKYIICSKERLDAVVNEFLKYNKIDTLEKEREPPSFAVDLRELDKFALIDPSIKIVSTDKTYTITWIENRTHIGIYASTYQIQRQFPFEIKKIKDDILLKITIGFFY